MWVSDMMQTLLEIYNHKEINLDVTHVDSMLRHYGDKRRLLVVTWSVSAVTAVEVETSFWALVCCAGCFHVNWVLTVS